MKITKHARKKLQELGYPDPEELLRHADDPTDNSVRWTTKRVKTRNRKPGEQRLHIEERRQTLTLIIKEERLITAYDASGDVEIQGASEAQRFDTLNRYLQCHGVTKMTWESFRSFEELILKTSSKRQFKVSKSGYRFPVEGQGRKIFVFYTIDEQASRIAPKFARGNTKIWHEGESIFFW